MIFNNFSDPGEWTVLGLMSGTSLDALDGARVRFAREGGKVADWELLDFRSRAMPGGLRARLEALICGESTDAAGFARLHLDFARACADFVLAEFSASGDNSLADLAAFPGQTVRHDPVGDGLSFQIGSAAAFAALTGIPTVGEFRLQDILGGGQGAPLVPLADALLFRSPTQSRALLNVGGIANLTLLPAGEGTDGVLGWDTGPGNTLMDAATRLATGEAWDQDGALAATGKVSEKHLRDWLIHPWFAQAPPRSTGRELFGGRFLAAAELGALLDELGPADLLASLAELTVTPVVQSLIGRDIHCLYVAGGGARNAHLMARLAARLAPLPVRNIEALGLPPEAREAVCFALLALEAAGGRPVTLPAVTGARRAGGAGIFSPGGGACLAGNEHQA